MLEKMNFEVDQLSRPSKLKSRQERPLDERVTQLLLNADLLIKYGEHDLSMNLLRQASNFEPFHRRVLERLAYGLSQKSQFAEEMVVRETICGQEEDFEAYAALGHSQYKLGQDSKALKSYFRAMDFVSCADDSLFEVYKNLGNIFVRQSDFEAAEEYFNKAYVLRTNSDALLVNFGILAIQKSDYERAKRHFVDALAIRAANDSAWTGLAMIYNQLGDASLAWGNLEKALDYNSLNRTAVILAANWGIRDAQESKAVERVSQYLENQNFDEEISLIFINLLCRQNKISIAVLEIEKLICWNPSNQNLWPIFTELRKAWKEQYESNV